MVEILKLVGQLQLSINSARFDSLPGGRLALRGFAWGDGREIFAVGGKVGVCGHWFAVVLGWIILRSVVFVIFVIKAHILYGKLIKLSRHSLKDRWQERGRYIEGELNQRYQHVSSSMCPRVVMKLLNSSFWEWKRSRRCSTPCLALRRSIVGFGFNLIFSEEVLLERLSLDSCLVLFFVKSSFFSLRLTSALFFLLKSLLFCINQAYDLMHFNDLSLSQGSLLTLRLMLKFSLSNSLLLTLFRCLLPNLCRSLFMPSSRPLRCEQMGLVYRQGRMLQVRLRSSDGYCSRLSLSSGYLKVQLLQCRSTFSSLSCAVCSFGAKFLIFSSSLSASRLTNDSSSFYSCWEQERRYALRVCRSAVNQKGRGAQSYKEVVMNLVRLCSRGFIGYKRQLLIILQSRQSRQGQEANPGKQQTEGRIISLNPFPFYICLVVCMDDEVQIQMGDYVFTQKYCIGQGSFGKVYRGRNIKSGREVAIKQMDGQLISQQDIGREITILKGLKHPNIVQYEDAFQNNGYFYIVTEYCKGGDLRSLLDNSDEEDNGDKEKKVLDMFWQVCEGFKYLRAFDIIHRDLKPSNILLQNGLYKIADFGLAKREMVHRSVVHQQLMGVPIYLSPQILSKNHYTYKCDVWSLGIIIFEMLYDHLPWKAQDIETLFFQIMNNPEPYNEHSGESSPIFIEIFKQTLSYLEKSRSSWDELLVLKDLKLGESKTKSKSKKKDKKEKKEDLQIGKINKLLSKEEAEVLKHIFGQGQSLQSELLGITNQECLRGLFSTIKKYLQQGSEFRGMLRDCCFIFLKLVANNLHLQLMEYEKLEQSRQLLVFIELLHDYISNAESNSSFKGGFQNSLRGRVISEYAASVISKVNTLLLSDQGDEQ